MKVKEILPLLRGVNLVEDEQAYLTVWADGSGSIRAKGSERRYAIFYDLCQLEFLVRGARTGNAEGNKAEDDDKTDQE